MPKQQVIQQGQDKPKGYMDTFTVIHDQAIQGWVCEEIMEDFFTLPMVDIIDEGGNSFMPVDESMRDKNHRYPDPHHKRFFLKFNIVVI